MREFAFELRLAAHLEASRESIIARQIGASVHAANRVMDLLLVEPGPEFDARTAITPETIPDAAIEADVGPGRARYWKDCFDRPTEYTRETVERAVALAEGTPAAAQAQTVEPGFERPHPGAVGPPTHRNPVQTPRARRQRAGRVGPGPFFSDRFQSHL